MSDHLTSIFSAFIILLLGYFIHDVKQEFRSLRQEIATARDLLTEKVIE